MDKLSTVRKLMATCAAGALAACGGGGGDVSPVATSSATADTTTRAQIAAEPSTVTWTQCAIELRTCSFVGTQQVRYGYNGTYATGTFTNGVFCDNSIFGDPLPGADKVCEVASEAPAPSPSPSPSPSPAPAPTPSPSPSPSPAPAPAPAPATWTFCANERTTCSFTGTRLVRYGANTTFVTGTFTGGVACDNRIFGDPLPRVEKHCELADEAPAPSPSPSPAPAPAPAPAAWTFCANERTTCSFTGTRLVRYGANTTFVTGTFTGGVACDNRIFGDPLPGVEKRCELAAEAPAPAPSPAPSPSPAPAPGPAPAPAPASLTMSCVEGVGYQCSGATLIRSANGVALTSSGVQVYGRSTGDVLYPSNPNIATGLALASGGLAEFRSAKDGAGVTLSTAILLKNLGISWDGVTDRPQIIELFDTTAGRVELGANGALVRSALPDAANLTFYDFATKGHNGTQANYANNRYFPRAAPSRCDPGDPCRTTETSGLNRTAGNWRSGGTRPDVTGGQRLHEDGDIHAGNGLPDANGNPTLLPGGNGIGVPFPGSKGVRDVVQWSYRYSNIGYWGTRDTIHLGGQWAAGNFFEHNTERTGVVTFGEVSDSNAIPTTGSATYNGFVYGSYASNGVVDRVNFNGHATVTVNFATRAVSVTVNNCVQEGSGTTLPISFVSSTTMGAVSAGEANYSTGTVSGTLSGGLSSRFFGPANVAGTNGSGPPEIGGAFSLSNSSAAAVVAGFIAYKN